MRLSQAQLAMYAAAAGAANPQLAAAVAMGESRGETTAHNVIPPDDSYGVWQINMRGDLGPARRKRLGITKNSELYDPGINARAMVMISGGGADFTPWSAYTSGKYRKHLPADANHPGTVQPVFDWNDPFGLLPKGWDKYNHSPGGDLLNNLGGAADAAGGAIDWIGRAGAWLGVPANWVRVGYVIGGGALVVVGLAMVIKEQGIAQASSALGKTLGTGVKKIRNGGGSGE